MARLRRSPQETEQEALGRFERTEAAWRALDAPEWLYDVQRAGEVYDLMCRPAYRLNLEGPQPLYCMPLRIKARRLWSTTRPAFLRRSDALTRIETRWLERWPQWLVWPRDFRPDYDLDDLLAGRLPTKPYPRSGADHV